MILAAGYGIKVTITKNPLYRVLFLGVEFSALLFLLVLFFFLMLLRLLKMFGLLGKNGILCFGFLCTLFVGSSYDLLFFINSWGQATLWLKACIFARANVLQRVIYLLSNHRIWRWRVPRSSTGTGVLNPGARSREQHVPGGWQGERWQWKKSIGTPNPALSNYLRA